MDICRVAKCRGIKHLLLFTDTEVNDTQYIPDQRIESTKQFLFLRNKEKIRAGGDSVTDTTPSFSREWERAKTLFHKKKKRFIN